MAIEEKAASIEEQSTAVVEAVLNGPHKDLADNIVTSIERGIVDLPFAAHHLVRGRAVVGRDSSGSLYFISCGDMPIKERRAQRPIGHMMAPCDRPLSDEASRLLRDIFYYSAYAD